jgi:integrase
MARKGTGVFVRGGVWWIRFTDQHGKQVRESTKIRVDAETVHQQMPDGKVRKLTPRDRALEVLTKERNEVVDRTFKIKRRRRGLTLEALRDEWLKHAEANDHKAIAADRQRWGVILDVLGAKTTVESLTNKALVDFRAKLLKRPTRRGATTSQLTANRVIALLRVSVNTCAQGHEVNVTEWPMAEEKRFRRNVVFSAKEIETLIAGAESREMPALALAIHLAATYPVRLGAIASLRWDQIDFKARTARLTGLQTKEGKPLTVDLIPDTIERLRAWKKAQDEAGKDLRYPGQVFQLKPPGTQTLSPMFGRLRDELGLKGKRFHDLKRTTASNLLAAGATIADVSEMSGTSPETIAKVYSAGVQRKRELLERAVMLAKQEADEDGQGEGDQ